MPTIQEIADRNGGLPLDPDTLTEADCEAMARAEGWHYVRTPTDDYGPGWRHPRKPDYAYQDAREIVDDFSLWQGTGQ